ncbi:catechol 2,3-dioxygenase [Croceicoccus estronivorus]|uniref:catechol 2,3-dioxygenase n=1 Tax=Croceicoccus estronivorus TaxID=1172626 RepID=UPI000829E734|nr:catechol 2,3-dioxygenase [Croceicoccus estronivorus]OCC23739.1 catechol 2,3-dioxygenase [Croceicoccus estronivorus]
MAVSGVLRPGFVQLRVLDMEKALWHYQTIIGLKIVSTGDDGRVYLRAFDEFDRHSVVLRPSDSAGIDCTGFKCDGEAFLLGAEKALEQRGVKTEWVAAGEQPGMGTRLRVHMPTGHLLDFYADAELSEFAPMTRNPHVFREPPAGAGAIRFDHCLLYGTNVAGAFEILHDVFGFELSEHLEDPTGQPLAIFLTASNKAHDIAFVEHPEPGKFHHASFLVEDWAAIGHAADLMAVYDVPVDIGPTRHGITRGKTIYFWDPSGNRNEVFAGGYTFYPDQPKRSWEFEQAGPAVFYYEKKLNETFLPVVT